MEPASENEVNLGIEPKVVRLLDLLRSRGSDCCSPRCQPSGCSADEDGADEDMVAGEGVISIRAPKPRAAASGSKNGGELRDGRVPAGALSSKDFRRSRGLIRR